MMSASPAPATLDPHPIPARAELPSPEVPIRTPSTGPAGSELPPILVADDDEDDRYFIRRLLSRTGAPNPIRTFADGAEVIAYLEEVRRGTPDPRQRPPLLLFLDLNMRGIGGFDFLVWARQRHRELAPLTIVVLSSSDASEDIARARELGAHRYLVKYPGLRTFTSIVRSVYPAPVALPASG